MSIIPILIAASAFLFVATWLLAASVYCLRVEVSNLRRHIDELEDDLFGPDDDPDDGEPIPEEDNVVVFRRAA